MGVLYDDPIPTADPDGVRVAYHIPCPFAVNVFPKIALIPENLCDGAASPEVIFKKAEPACPGTASRPLIQHGRGYVVWYFPAVPFRRRLTSVMGRVR